MLNVTSKYLENNFFDTSYTYFLYSLPKLLAIILYFLIKSSFLNFINFTKCFWFLLDKLFIFVIVLFISGWKTSLFENPFKSGASLEKLNNFNRLNIFNSNLIIPIQTKIYYIQTKINIIQMKNNLFQSKINIITE